MDDPSELDTASIRFDELFGALMEDAKEAFKRASEDPSMHNRRVAFRVAFSAIEGIVFLLKDQLFAGPQPIRNVYSNAEIAMLREETYQLDNRGNVITKGIFLRLPDNLQFAWNMYFRSILPDFQADLGGDGWRCLLSSLSVRNRITHPRSAQDLEVSDQDMANLQIGYDWVQSTTFKNMAGALLRIRKIKKQLDAPPSG